MRGSSVSDQGLSKKTYFVAGDEPLQSNEFCDSLRLRALQSGIAERLFFEPAGQDGWLVVETEINSLSLFARRRFIEIYFTGKLSKKGEEVVKKIASRKDRDDIYLIKTDALDSKAKRTEWFASLKKEAEVVSFVQPLKEQLPNWILKRFGRLGKKVSKEAAELIAERTEGNLLATAQEIQKLCLIIESENVTLQKVLAPVTNDARFGIYDFRDSMLEGNVVKSINICRVLRNTGAEALIINWMIKKELRGLVKAALCKESGKNINIVLQSLRVWGPRAKLVQLALERADFYYWLELLIEAANIGTVIKGIDVGDPWEQLELLVVRVCKGSDNFNNRNIA